MPESGVSVPAADGILRSKAMTPKVQSVYGQRQAGAAENWVERKGLTSLRTARTALLDSPSLGTADTQSSMVVSVKAVMPSRTLLAPGLT